MNKKWIVGVMGGGDVSSAHHAATYRLGQSIAKNGWVLLNGGRARPRRHGSFEK